MKARPRSRPIATPTQPPPPPGQPASTLPGAPRNRQGWGTPRRVFPPADGSAVRLIASNGLCVSIESDGRMEVLAMVEAMREALDKLERSHRGAKKKARVPR